MNNDLVGLGWRTELAPFIFTNLEHIDVVEVILDDLFKRSLSEIRAFRMLTNHVPVIYHGVGLGLASSFPLQQQRVDKLARVLDYLAPDIWSEHLAFVRAGNIEIGHLAAPPRTQATIDGALENLHHIQLAIGLLPSLENIATLIDPPGSKMTESIWISEILEQSNGNLLLDLNNLYANAINFGFNPITYLQAFPLHRVNVIHLSGGKWINEPQGKGKRLLDDHIHDVPDPVFDLLSIVAHTVRQPLTVIIERDGNYPDFQVLLNQINRTKLLLQQARKEQASRKGGSLERTIV